MIAGIDFNIPDRGQSIKQEKLLFEAEMVFDLDYAVIKYIQTNLADGDIFDLDILSSDDNTILTLLKQSTSRNPLSIIVKDMSSEEQDDLLNEIMESDRDGVIRCLTPTSIYDFIETYIKSYSPDTITLLFKDNDDVFMDLVREYLDDEDLLNKFELKKSDGKFDVTGHTSIYCKYIEDIKDRYKNLSIVNIYVGDLNINLEQDILKAKNIRVLNMELMLELSMENEVRLISLYSIYLDSDNYEDISIDDLNIDEYDGDEEGEDEDE